MGRVWVFKEGLPLTPLTPQVNTCPSLQRPPVELGAWSLAVPPGDPGLFPPRMNRTDYTGRSTGEKGSGCHDPQIAVMEGPTPGYLVAWWLLDCRMPGFEVLLEVFTWPTESLAEEFRGR